MKIIKVATIDLDEMEVDVVYENALYHEKLNNVKYIKKDSDGILYAGYDLKTWNYHL